MSWLSSCVYFSRLYADSIHHFFVIIETESLKFYFLCFRGCLFYRTEGKILMSCNSSGMHTIAAQLLGSGASINDTMSDGQTLLHMAIQRQDSKSALFLLEHQADINVR